jgi:hypothetical protein
LEGAGELREAVDETDHHQVDVCFPGAAQVDAPEEVPFRVVSDPREGYAEEDARFEAAQEGVHRASVVVPGVALVGKEDGRCDRHDHLAAADRVAERAASAESEEGSRYAPAHDRDFDTADLCGDQDHGATDRVAKAMYVASVEG